MTESHRFPQADLDRLPRHVAIIMDGNGRWARSRNLSRLEGHRAGVEAVDRIVSFCTEIGVGALTLFALSTENLQRPPAEVAGLMEILKQYLRNELPRMMREGIRFNAIGRLESLPAEVQELIGQVRQETAENTRLILSMALNYGARSELTRAVAKIARMAREGRLEPDMVTEEVVEASLDTAGLPPVDLLIRTSGEMRISNFLLWQLAYAELFFTDTLWPDFAPQDLLEAIASFQKRQRRYGLTQEQVISLPRIP